MNIRRDDDIPRSVEISLRYSFAVAVIQWFISKQDHVPDELTKRLLAWGCALTFPLGKMGCGK